MRDRRSASKVLRTERFVLKPRLGGHTATQQSELADTAGASPLARSPKSANSKIGQYSSRLPPRRSATTEFRPDQSWPRPQLDELPVRPLTARHQCQESFQSPHFLPLVALPATFAYFARARGGHRRICNHNRWKVVPQPPSEPAQGDAAAVDRGLPTLWPVARHPTSAGLPADNKTRSPLSAVLLPLLRSILLRSRHFSPD